MQDICNAIKKVGRQDLKQMDLKSFSFSWLLDHFWLVGCTFIMCWHWLIMERLHSFSRKRDFIRYFCSRDNGRLKTNNKKLNEVYIPSTSLFKLHFFDRSQQERSQELISSSSKQLKKVFLINKQLKFIQNQGFHQDFFRVPSNSKY